MTRFITKSFITLVAVVLSASVLAQPNFRIPNMELRSAVYNTLIGSFSGSIGSIINKKKQEKWGPVLARGFFVGSVGGSMMYCGKKMSGLISQKNELAYAWLARAIYSGGNSIVENAVANRPFNAVWHFDLGFIRLEYTGESGKLQPKLMPANMIGTVYVATKGKFDLPRSLRLGIPVFYTRVIQNDPSIAGFTPGNAILYRSTDNPPATLTRNLNHEVIHTFQYEDFNAFNHFTKPYTDHLQLQSKRYQRYKKWVYPDLSHEFMILNYFVVNKGGNGINYCYNFLENEAQFFATNKCTCE